MIATYVYELRYTARCSNSTKFQKGKAILVSQIIIIHNFTNKNWDENIHITYHEWIFWVTYDIEFDSIVSLLHCQKHYTCNRKLLCTRCTPKQIQCALQWDVWLKLFPVFYEDVSRFSTYDKYCYYNFSICTFSPIKPNLALSKFCKIHQLHGKCGFVLR